MSRSRTSFITRWPLAVSFAHAAVSFAHAAVSFAHAHGDLGALLPDPVPLVDEHDLRLVEACRRLLHPGKGRDDHEVARPHEMRGGAVHADDAAVRRSLDGVGLEAVAVGDVPHADGLVRQEIRSVHQPPVDRDRALVVDVRLGHGGAVDLGSHHLAHHRSSPSGTSIRLSISLTPPTHTARASSAGPATSVTSASVSGSLSSAYSSRARPSKTATSGRTAWKSFVTTVVTPRKCPGRAAPQSGSVRRATSTADWNPSGYIAAALGA